MHIKAVFIATNSTQLNWSDSL